VPSCTKNKNRSERGDQTPGGENELPQNPNGNLARTRGRRVRDHSNTAEDLDYDRRIPGASISMSALAARVAGPAL
jgi:hypothetical protein